MLPNKDNYKLISIVNHLGAFIKNGHYQALVKIGSKWIMADDNNIQKTNLFYEITGNNYIFVYKKFSTIIPFVATTYWEEVLEDQPIPAGLHVQLDTQTGGKIAKLLEKTNSTDGNHKQNSFERDNGNYDYEQEPKSSYTYCYTINQEKKSRSNKITRQETKSSCKGCKREFGDVNHHIKRSFPCQNYYKVDELIDLCSPTPTKENDKKKE